MIVAVLDANVLTSGLAGMERPASIPGELQRRWERGEFVVVLSDHLVDEVVRALEKPYFRAVMPPEVIAAAPAVLRRRANMVVPVTPVAGVATHPSDDLVIATAVDGRVDYLVTGDAALLRLGSYRGVAIVTPRDFLAVLTADEQGSESE